MKAYTKTPEAQADTKLGLFAGLHKRVSAVKTRASEKYLVGCGTLFLSLPTWAQDQDFGTFREKIEELAGGDFAIGISVLALIMGCLFGLAKQSVAPAFLGLGIAGAFAVGPYLIIQIFEWFA
ncbi:hypothetical protein ACT3UM_22730 [Halomonas sp. AOP13-D3-9]